MPLAQPKVSCLQGFTVSALNLGALTEYLEIILDIDQELQLLIGTFVIVRTTQFWTTLRCIIEVYGATFFVLMFNGTVKRNVAWVSVLCAFFSIYPSRIATFMSRAEDMSLGMPICSCQSVCVVRCD